MRRTAIALALAASTLTATPSGLFHPLWSFLSSFWGQAKAGAGVDPSGRSLTAPQNKSDAGPGVDPDGRSLTTPQPTTDEGPRADPNG
ncbi:MAG TPA: hypothetical protein VLX28_11955 [Thermoanaerobaculia bacterium]|nr:hypothetical protein [Thermoanaerobaculia bacterium]